MNDKLASRMSKIQALLAKAESTQSQFPEEAAAYYTKAEELMRLYRIDEEQLIATDQFAAVPVMHSLYAMPTQTEFHTEYSGMMYWIKEHCGIETVMRWNNDNEEPGYWFDLFGYEGDLRMAEWLWSSARLVFGSHLEPSVDSKLSDQVNAYNLRQAGILRKDIARKLWGENTPANRSRAQRLYLAECKVRGEQPLLTGPGSDAEQYRESYAQGFVYRLSDRLRASRDAVDSTGGVMVLHGRADRVREAMYTAYPNRRPKPRTEVDTIETTPVPAKVDGRRKSWTKADERAYRRRTGASAQAGHRAGGVAAGKVQINRTHTQAQRVDPAPMHALEG